jgi:hypothetical protein
MKVLIQFPSGEETTLDEAVEAASTQGDKFIEWEAERMLCKTIGDFQDTKHHG